MSKASRGDRRRRARLGRLARSASVQGSSRALQRRRRELSPEWRRWLAENLEAGADPGLLRETLRTHGVPVLEAMLRLREASENVALARRHARRADQAELVLRLSRSLRAGQIERRKTPCAEEFFIRYWATNTPVILTDLVRVWPAFERWCPAYFRDRFGDVEIEYEGGRADDPEYDINYRAHRRVARFSEYLDRIAVASGNDLYLIANNQNLARSGLRPLFDDLRLPPGYFDEDHLASGSALWLGPAGTVTSLHHDTSNILLCQVVGRKHLRLGAPDDPVLLASARGVYSRIDPETSGPVQTPGGIADFYNVELAAGEALFLPVGWWHHVRALEFSISVALNAFARANIYSWFKPGAVPQS